MARVLLYETCMIAKDIFNCYIKLKRRFSHVIINTRLMIMLLLSN